MMDAIPDANVHEVQPDVLAGLMFLPRWVGYQPYLVIFKQFPHCIGTGLDVQGVEGTPDLEGNIA